jgi:hypothetical protein
MSLARFKRGETDELVVAMREYEGHAYLDVRVYFRAEDGQQRPTRKGVTIKLNELHVFSDAIAKAVEIAERGRR